MLKHLGLFGAGDSAVGHHLTRLDRVNDGLVQPRDGA